jgi:hypothetical protein
MLDQPAERGGDEDREQRRVLEPFAGLLGWRQVILVLADIDAEVLGGHRRVAGRRRPDADHGRDRDQHEGDHHRLPEEDRLGERDHPGDRQEPGGARSASLRLSGVLLNLSPPAGAASPSPAP